jgi:hypothetical protein
MRYALVWSVLLATMAFGETARQSNLLTNGDFADVHDRKPAGWNIPAEGHDIYVDKEEHPRETPQALKVEIRKAGEGQVGISQTIRNVPANTKLVLSAIMKGSNKRLAYVLVKLKKAGKELKRERTDWNTDDWKLAKVEFDTGDADELTIECRFSQANNAKDEAVWFANVVLEKAGP